LVCDACRRAFADLAAAQVPLFFDNERWEPIPLPAVPADPLKFKDDKTYPSRIKGAKNKIAKRDKEEAPDSGAVSPIAQDDCMAAAFGKVNGIPTVILVQDFAFMGGSLGMAAGEGFIAAAQMAVARKAAFVICTASGGARMQEGTLSLMQMPQNHAGDPGSQRSRPALSGGPVRPDLWRCFGLLRDAWRCAYRRTWRDDCLLRTACN
jgi:acetyl-CoA carboxylase beta subunit